MLNPDLLGGLTKDATRALATTTAISVLATDGLARPLLASMTAATSFLVGLLIGRIPELFARRRSYCRSAKRHLGLRNPPAMRWDPQTGRVTCRSDG